MKIIPLCNLFKIKRGYIAFIDQGMVSGINFLIGIILARNLGIYDFGVYSLVWMIVLFINSVQLSLITSPMMSIGPKQTKDPEYFSVTLLQQLLFSLISFLLIILFGVITSFVTPQYNSLILLVSLVSVAFQLQEFIRKYFFTIGKLLIAFVVDCINYLIQIILIIYLVTYSQISIFHVLWIIVISSFLSFVFGFLYFEKRQIKVKNITKILKRNWNYGSWLALYNITQFFGSQGVLAIAGIYLTPSTLGGIRALQNLIAPINVLILAIQNIIPIKASIILEKSGYSQFVKYLIKIFTPIFFFILFIGIVATFFSREIITIIYGNEYETYSKYIFYFVIYSLLGALIVPQTIYFRSIEYTKPLAVAPILAAPISIGITCIFIKDIGIIAVFLGLISNYLIIFLVLIFFSIKKNFSSINIKK